MELDPSRRAWSGGIYDDPRWGWIYPLSVNEKARNALQLGQWNRVRIEAIGSTINTWINGVHCDRLVDDMTAEGVTYLGYENGEASYELVSGSYEFTMPWQTLYENVVRMNPFQLESQEY